MEKTMDGIARFFAGVARQLGLRPRHPVEIPFRISGECRIPKTYGYPWRPVTRHPARTYNRHHAR